MRIHTGEKPYKCTHPGCNKDSARKQDMQKHMLTHTRERPYPCEHPGCNKAFAELGNRNAHMKTCTHKSAAAAAAQPYVHADQARNAMESHPNYNNAYKYAREILGLTNEAAISFAVKNYKTNGETLSAMDENDEEN
jgi:uncharacterized Zn-finger protein